MRADDNVARPRRNLIPGGRAVGNAKASSSTPQPHGRTRRRAHAASILAATALALLALPAAAAANQPWWHLASGTRPTYLHPGAAEAGTSEVQEVIVKASGGGFVLANMSEEEALTGPYFIEEPGPCEFAPRFAEFQFDAGAAEIQSRLEEPCGFYGPGNVEVSGGPGDASGSSPYLIAFKGARAEAPQRIVSVGIPAEPEEAGGPGPLEGTIEAKVKTAAQPGKADGEIYVSAVNVGDAPALGEASEVELSDVLSPGLAATAIAATKSHVAGDFQEREAIPCDFATLTCELKGSLAPFDTLEMKIEVELGAGGVEPLAHSGELNEVRISGGEAPATSITRPIVVSGDPVPFGVAEYEQRLEEEGGGAATQAGEHPFQLTTQIALDQGRDINPLENEQGRPEVAPAGLAKDFAFKLPPGLVGSATTIPECTTADFFATTPNGANRCPPDSAVGVAVATVHEPATVGTSTLTEPIFNLEPNFGEPARFGFYVVIANTPVFIGTELRSAGDYGITATVPNLTQTGSVLSSTATFWGVPGDSRHDQQRGWGCLLDARGANQDNLPCHPSEEPNPRPLLSLPTSCAEPLRAEGELDQWNVGVFSPFTGVFSPAAALGGCGRLPFGPTFDAQPNEKQGDSPTGFTVDLNLKQEGLENASGLAESHLKKVTVALPSGLTTNPSIANGLGACTLAQYDSETLGNQSCPESSRVGEVEIESPLVAQVIHGSVYVAKQHDNPADNLLSIYVVAKDPELGVLVKTAGAVTPNAQTGRLTTTFDELPRLPFSHFHFAFDRGQRAPLITPGLCGTYATQADLYPYSNPGVPVHREAKFTVSSGAGGAPCAASEAQLPNKPSLEAGTLTPIAGAYSPFVFKVSREDGSQPFSVISATLPTGLLGKLAGVSECSGTQIAAAAARSSEGEGAAELAHPSCPVQSQVGTVDAATGAGPQPYHVQGKAYLAGPYKGAPLSLAILTPAVVGPFDLGNVVIRTALYVNPETAEIHAVSDPIPAILHGLPTVVRSISLNTNRPNFTLNPTSCDPKQITGQVISTLGNIAPLQERFQVGACNALGFRPNLTINLKGGTKRSKHPALTATLTYPKGSYANVAKASVALPHSEFLEQAHIKTICTRVQFNAGAGNGSQCPKGSIYGKASATTPLLDKPLSGPVYLRSSNHPLPDLVAALHGQIDVALIGRLDSINGGIRSSFDSVPDAPVSKFTLRMQGGKKGLLVNSTNLCKSTNRAVSKLTAQNGKTYDTEPVVTAKCGRKAKKGKAHKHRSAH